MLIAPIQTLYLFFHTFSVFFCMILENFRDVNIYFNDLYLNLLIVIFFNYCCFLLEMWVFSTILYFNRLFFCIYVNYQFHYVHFIALALVSFPIFHGRFSLIYLGYTSSIIFNLFLSHSLVYYMIITDYIESKYNIFSFTFSSLLYHYN